MQCRENESRFHYLCTAIVYLIFYPFKKIIFTSDITGTIWQRMAIQLPALPPPTTHQTFLVQLVFCPSITLSPASQASREVANLTERKNPHNLVYGVKEYIVSSEPR